MNIKRVDEVFKDNFGYTPLKERLDDILRECLELTRFRDINNLKEETGDLLSSLIQLCNESGWNPSDLVNNTLDKIEKRKLQYKSLGRKYQVAILGGAFNPITEGHIQIAKFVLNTSKQIDEVWLSPSYKHMYNKEMVSYEDRYKMCELAANTDGRIKVFDYEKVNNLGGETYHFLKSLTTDKNYENYNFSFIIGQDNANTFDKWFNYENLEKLVRFIVIPRVGFSSVSDAWYLKQPHIFLNYEKPIMEVSSTEVRNKIVKNEDVSGLLNNEVLEYINKNKFYR